MNSAKRTARVAGLLYLLVGCWYRGYANEYLRWNDDDFEIGSGFSRGRKSLGILNFPPLFGQIRGE